MVTVTKLAVVACLKIQCLIFILIIRDFVVMLNAVVLGVKALLEIIINEMHSCLCLCRAAIVYLKSPSDAKAAVKDLHGCSLQGHTVQVVQLRGPASADPKLISDPPHSTSKTHKEAAAGDGLGTKGVTYTSSPGVSMTWKAF